MVSRRTAAVLAAMALGFTACVASNDPESMSTTSEVDSTTTHVSAPEPTRVVGVVGCSMTLNALEGYKSLGGERLWPRAGLAYGRGSVARWSDPAFGFWESFDQALARSPDTGAIWWQLCTSESEADDLEHALDVLASIEGRLPEAQIFVSSQPDYADGHVCSSAGPDGPKRMAALAENLIAAGHVEPGPTFDRLGVEQLEDSCHANEEGKTQMGAQVLEFFDRHN